MKKFLAVLSIVAVLGSFSSVFAKVVRPSTDDCAHVCSVSTNSAIAFMECMDRCMN